MPPLVIIGIPHINERTTFISDNNSLVCFKSICFLIIFSSKLKIWLISDQSHELEEKRSNQMFESHLTQNSTTTF